MWHVTCDRWHVTHDMWHVTRDTWHVTHDTWCGVNILSKFQLSSSNGLGFMMLWISGGKGSVTRSVNDEAVCRTAPATPGLLNTMTVRNSMIPSLKSAIYSRAGTTKFAKPPICGVHLVPFSHCTVIYKKKFVETKCLILLKIILVPSPYWEGCSRSRPFRATGQQGLDLEIKDEQMSWTEALWVSSVSVSEGPIVFHLTTFCQVKREKENKTDNQHHVSN